MTPPEVQRYLRRATVLLAPAPARRVRAELHGHLHQSMLDAHVQGLTEEEAWATALNAAGSALPAALRLARVHTLGHILRGLLGLGALGGAAYAIQGNHSLQPTHVEVHP